MQETGAVGGWRRGVQKTGHDVPEHLEALFIRIKE